MKTITVSLRRFSIKVGDLEPFEADAYIPLRDELTKELVGLTWIICHEDRNEVGTVYDMPYLLIDREYPHSLQDFLSLANSPEKPTIPKGYG
jgi:hypothetical protein